jgi:hypothetical protein
VRRTAAAALWAVLAVPALGEDAPEPPVWAYLAECSAVFGAVASSDGYSGGDPHARSDAAAAADLFLGRAVAAAGEAGQADPEADVASIMAYLVPRWENRVESILSLKSNLDWIDYCRRLGTEHGLLAQ